MSSGVRDPPPYIIPGQYHTLCPDFSFLLLHTVQWWAFCGVDFNNILLTFSLRLLKCIKLISFFFKCPGGLRNCHHEKPPCCPDVPLSYFVVDSQGDNVTVYKVHTPFDPKAAGASDYKVQTHATTGECVCKCAGFKPRPAL